MLYDLFSVSCAIDSETLIVYKIDKDGKRKKWRHLDQSPDFWFGLLSIYDFGTIDNLINTR